MEPATTNGLFESVGDNSLLTQLSAALKEIVTSEPENQKLRELCHTFLAEVSSINSLQQAGLELSPDEVEPAAADDDEGAFPELARESRQIPTDQLQRFAAFLR
jgi:hypothetical protein